jgi:hypothetical protein
VLLAQQGADLAMLLLQIEQVLQVLLREGSGVYVHMYNLYNKLYTEFYRILHYERAESTATERYIGHT